jgi:multiple sugar transport system substrate-binding protein
MKFLEWLVRDDVQKRWAELRRLHAHAETFESEEFRKATPITSPSTRRCSW